MNPSSGPFSGPLSGAASGTWTGVAAILAAASALLPTTSAAQRTSDVIATYEVQKQRRQISRKAVALELSRVYRARESGEEAMDHLIDRVIVERTAKRKGLMPSRREINKKVAEFEAAYRSKKMDLNKEIARRRMTRRSFEEELALGLAKQRLVLDALGEKKVRAPSSTEVELWSKEAREQSKIVLDIEKLPAGVIAKVDDIEITRTDLGEVLLVKASRAVLQQAVNDLVFRDCVTTIGRAEGLEVTEKDIDAEVKARKARAQRRHPKLKFEDVLKATLHMTTEQYRKDPHLRSQVMLRKLTNKHLTDDVVRARYKKDKDQVERMHGQRRSLSILLVRATDRPNQIIKRTFEQALIRAKALRKRILEKDTFANVARLTSDHRSRVDGGKIGWQNRERKPSPAPQEVLDVAFELKIGKISQPIKTKGGYYLVWVGGIEATPVESQILRRLRGQMVREYVEKLRDDANIKLKIQ